MSQQTASLESSLSSSSSVPSALNFLENYRKHQQHTEKVVKSLEDKFLHERVYITLTCLDSLKRVKTAGVVTDISGTLSTYYRFTIVTEQGREMTLRHDINSDKTMLQGSVMQIKMEAA